ncbi:MAG: hypothetical protein ACK53Y_25250 [bacterium]
MSKYYEFKEYVQNLTANNICIYLIIIQETWNIPYPALVGIDGFQQIVFRTRTGLRGGGVGIYVKKWSGIQSQERFGPAHCKIF